MSRFIEKINKQSGNPPSPMGFHKAGPREAAPKILIMARVSLSAAGTPVKSIEGADAALLDAGDFQLTAKALPKMTKPLQGIPWGVFLENCEDKPEDLAETGCDFAVLSPACPVSTVPQNEKISKILQVESSMDDGLLRAVNYLPVDAVLAADTFGEGGTLLWHHLMLLRSLAMLISKPLIVPVPAAITKAELKALWDAGIEAVLVPVDIARDENLKELHDIAASLPPRAAQKHDKMNISLPRTGVSTEQPYPDEEEEDE